MIWTVILSLMPSVGPQVYLLRDMYHIQKSMKNMSHSNIWRFWGVRRKKGPEKRFYLPKIKCIYKIYIKHIYKIDIKHIYRIYIKHIYKIYIKHMYKIYIKHIYKIYIQHIYKIYIKHMYKIDIKHIYIYIYI